MEKKAFEILLVDKNFEKSFTLNTLLKIERILEKSKEGKKIIKFFKKLLETFGYKSFDEINFSEMNDKLFTLVAIPTVIFYYYLRYLRDQETIIEMYGENYENLIKDLQAELFHIIIRENLSNIIRKYAIKYLPKLMLNLLFKEK